MAEQLILEAKTESTDKLIDLLCPHIYNGLQTMYKQASKLNEKESIKMFQISLHRIPVLPENILKTDYQYLLNEGHCNEVELTKLIESLFICLARLNMIAQGQNFNTKINLQDLEIPSNMNFLHQCYINAARDVYNSAYLFSHKYNAGEQAQNREFINQKIAKAITKTIRELIPLQTIFNKYINNDANETSSEQTKGAPSTRNNLESLMGFSIDTSFVNDLNQKASFQAKKLNSENVSQLQKKIAEKETSINSKSQPSRPTSLVGVASDLDNQKSTPKLDLTQAEEAKTIQSVHSVQVPAPSPVKAVSQTPAPSPVQASVHSVKAQNPVQSPAVSTSSKAQSMIGAGSVKPQASPAKSLPQPSPVRSVAQPSPMASVDEPSDAEASDAEASDGEAEPSDGEQDDEFDEDDLDDEDQVSDPDNQVSDPEGQVSNQGSDPKDQASDADEDEEAPEYMDIPVNTDRKTKENMEATGKDSQFNIIMDESSNGKSDEADETQTVDPIPVESNINETMDVNDLLKATEGETANVNYAIEDEDQEGGGEDEDVNEEDQEDQEDHEDQEDQQEQEDQEGQEDEPSAQGDDQASPLASQFGAGINLESDELSENDMQQGSDEDEDEPDIEDLLEDEMNDEPDEDSLEEELDEDEEGEDQEQEQEDQLGGDQEDQEEQEEQEEQDQEEQEDEEDYEENSEGDYDDGSDDEEMSGGEVEDTANLTNDEPKPVTTLDLQSLQDSIKQDHEETQSYNKFKDYIKNLDKNPPATAPKIQIKVAPKPQASPKLAPQQSPKVMPQASPKITPQASPKVMPQTSPKIAPQASPKVVPQASPKVAPQASPKMVPQPSPKVAPQASPKVAPQASPKMVPQPSPKVATQAPKLQLKQVDLKVNTNSLTSMVEKLKRQQMLNKNLAN